VIHDIGIDIVKIERIRNAVEKWGQRFTGRVFSHNEIQFCLTRHDPFPCLAARFAAKEALLKSVEEGIFNDLREIIVLNYDSGKPYIKVQGKLENLLNQKGIGRIHLSLSHEKEYAVAMVVAEKQKK
jgi:holo-[acyl-carrier protein] synthase